MAPIITTEDYYRVLEVSQTATTELIRKSYLRLALKYHPDRNGSKEGFQLVCHSPIATVVALMAAN